MVPRCKICTWHCKQGEWEECIILSRKGEKRQYDRKRERERKRPADARQATKVGWREQFEDRTDGFIGKNSQSAERINAAIGQSWGRIRHLEQLPKETKLCRAEKRINLIRGLLTNYKGESLCVGSTRSREREGDPIGIRGLNISCKYDSSKFKSWWFYLFILKKKRENITRFA